MQYPQWSRGEPSGSGPRILRKALVASALCFGAASLTGCVARLQPIEARAVYGYPVVEVETVPVTIVSYPRVFYRGSYAYLVDGEWYYRDGGAWVRFRREPRELRAYRLEIERRGEHRRQRRPDVEVREHRDPRFRR